jgi:hypothetical protein
MRECLVVQRASVSSAEHGITKARKQFSPIAVGVSGPSVEAT